MCVSAPGGYLVPGGVPGLGGVPGPEGVCSWGVYLVRGSVWSQGGICSQGGVWSQGGCLVPGEVAGPQGVSALRGCTWFQGGAPSPGGCTWSMGVYLVHGGVPGLGCVCSGDVPGLGGVSAPGGQVSAPRWGGVCSWGYTWSRGAPGQVLPPWTEFLTHASENITLPQTSFAGSKNVTFAFDIEKQVNFVLWLHVRCPNFCCYRIGLNRSNKFKMKSLVLYYYLPLALVLFV